MAADPSPLAAPPQVPRPAPGAVTRTEQLAAWGSGLRLAAIPDRVVAAAGDQILSQLAAIRATLAHPLGERITAAFGPVSGADPARVAHTLAALSIALDFDDTAYAGHLSHSCVNVPLAYAPALRLDGARLLTAVIAANECAGRVAAAVTLGPLRGQMAAHTHLVGAVAARLHAERAPRELWVAALGLALGNPPVPVARGFYASDAKLLSAAVPVRIGLDACDAARAGLVGAADILEHPDGFVARLAEVPLPEAATAGLGSRWHSETFSAKSYPGSAYTSAAVECAVELHQRLGPVAAAEVIEVEVAGSIFTALLERTAATAAAGAVAPLPQASFSLGYNVATALGTGDLIPADLTEAALAGPERRALAAKVRVVHEVELTERALRGTAPLGEALRQAGPRARDWVVARGGAALAAGLDGLGAPARSFEDATKQLGARVTVRLRDGREASATRVAARGSLGRGAEAGHRVVARERFLATGGAAQVIEALTRLRHLDAPQVAELLAVAISDRR